MCHNKYMYKDIQATSDTMDQRCVTERMCAWNRRVDGVWTHGRYRTCHYVPAPGRYLPGAGTKRQCDIHCIILCNLRPHSIQVKIFSPTVTFTWAAAMVLDDLKIAGYNLKKNRLGSLRTFTLSAWSAKHHGCSIENAAAQALMWSRLKPSRH